MAMTNQELRLHIKALGKGHKLPCVLTLGLCCEVNTSLDTIIEQQQIVREVMRQWPKCSKDRNFPVFHSAAYPPVSAFHVVNNLWESGKQRYPEDIEYVNSRLQMCCWIADQLEKLEDWK